MTFDQYIELLPGKLSDVKLLILKTLWESGGLFPKNWVQSSTLLKLTGQKYFDRRIRELRDEFGCDIATASYDGKPSYRLVSLTLSKFKPRQYLTEPQKRTLFEKDKFTCQVCGRKVPPGVQGLQADHKIPLIKGGGHDYSNWQSLCNECNVGKRGACADCKAICEQCSWAFPEKGIVTAIKIPKTIMQKIQNRGAKNNAEIEMIIIKAIEKFLSDDDNIVNNEN